MASTLLLRILKKTINFTTTTAPILTRTCHTVTSKPRRRFRNNLYSRISPLGNPDTSLVPVLDKWVEEGKKVMESELQRIVRDLRSNKRYAQALQISEWMTNRDLPFSAVNDTSLIPVLDKWVQEGNQLEELELQRIVRDLRSHKRYSQALQNLEENPQVHNNDRTNLDENMPHPHCDKKGPWKN
ncbi:hypothetical protein QYF36_003504 [Acer negundo]|nr:hypothetical protein QYF36_003504 [Acer negundo]